MVLCIRNFNGIQDFNALAHTSNSLSLVTLLDSIIKVPVSLVIIILSLTEHHRSIRPSALLELYFLLSVPPDILSTKYQDLFTTKKANNIASIVSTIADLAPLLAEARSKVAVLLPEYQAMSPEALSGFINRCIFWWLQPLFVLGSSRLLGMRDLYPLDEKLGEGKLGVDLKEKWGYSCKCSISDRFLET